MGSGVGGVEEIVGSVGGEARRRWRRHGRWHYQWHGHGEGHGRHGQHDGMDSMGSGIDLAISSGSMPDDLGLGIVGEDGVIVADGLELNEGGVRDEGEHHAGYITRDPMSVGGVGGGSLRWGFPGVDDARRVSCRCPS